MERKHLTECYERMACVAACPTARRNQAHTDGEVARLRSLRDDLGRRVHVDSIPGTRLG